MRRNPFVADAEKNNRLGREHRDPWKLPVIGQVVKRLPNPVARKECSCMARSSLKTMRKRRRIRNKRLRHLKPIKKAWKIL